MNTRKVRKKDRDALVEITRRTDLFTKTEQEVAIELIDASISDPDDGYETTLAYEGEDICGYICWGDVPMTRGTYEIYWVAVDPKHRRKGVGRILLKACERTARRRKARLLLLETSAQDRYGGTREFYLDCGFEVQSTIADYYKPGDDLVVFGKRFT